MLILFAVITILAVWFVYTSVRLDVGIVPEAGASWAAGIRAGCGVALATSDGSCTRRTRGRACWRSSWCLTYGFFWEALSFDLSMSLDMHFESTLYGWWWFMTAWIGAIMVFSLLTMWWREDAAR